MKSCEAGTRECFVVFHNQLISPTERLQILSRGFENFFLEINWFLCLFSPPGDGGVLYPLHHSLPHDLCRTLAWTLDHTHMLFGSSTQSCQPDPRCCDSHNSCACVGTCGRSQHLLYLKECQQTFAYPHTNSFLWVCVKGMTFILMKICLNHVCDKYVSS